MPCCVLGQPWQWNEDSPQRWFTNHLERNLGVSGSRTACSSGIGGLSQRRIFGAPGLTAALGGGGGVIDVAPPGFGRVRPNLGRGRQPRGGSTEARTTSTEVGTDLTKFLRSRQPDAGLDRPQFGRTRFGGCSVGIGAGSASLRSGFTDFVIGSTDFGMGSSRLVAGSTRFCGLLPASEEFQ